jgi:hypothetical protein
MPFEEAEEDAVEKEEKGLCRICDPRTAERLTLLVRNRSLAVMHIEINSKD